MTKLFWCLVVAILIVWLGNIGSVPPREVHGLFPDERVKWEIHPVGGFILKRPGVKAQMVLPDGTLIYIPRPAKPGYADSTSHSS